MGAEVVISLLSFGIFVTQRTRFNKLLLPFTNIFIHFIIFPKTFILIMYYYWHWKTIRKENILRYISKENFICNLQNQGYIFIIILILVIYSYKIYFFIVKDDIDKIKRKPSISNPKKCLKCNKLACTFADCNEFNYYVCLPVRHLNRHLSSFTFNL